jgi:protein lifeguard
LGVCLTFIDQTGSQNFYNTSPALALLGLSLVTYMVCLYAIGCYRSVARSVPTNYILLGLFTVAFSYITAGISCFYEPDVVLAAASMTAAMTIGLTAYALYTKKDFTYCGGLMFAFMFVVFAGMILSFFLPKSIARILLSAIVVMILCLYIIFDIQVIVGNRALALEIDDYVFAAMMLYLDIMRLFLELLKILGRK